MIEPKKSLAAAQAYGKPGLQRKNRVRMDHNENDWGCSQEVLDALTSIDPYDVAVYPEQERLISLLAGHHRLAAENLLLSGGSDDGIRCIMDTYPEPGDSAIIPVPAYSVYPLFCRMRDIAVKEVSYQASFAFPVEGVIDALDTSVKLIVIVSPGNPTGSVITEDGLRNVLSAAPDAAVLVDEAYAQFCGQDFTRLVQKYKNLFVVRTFSKVYGLAGLRLGYVVSAEENIRNLKKTAMPYSANTLALIAGCAALADRDFVAATVRKTMKEKTYLKTELGGMGLTVLDSEANFLQVRTGDFTGFLFSELRKRDIFLRNMQAYPKLNGYLRVTAGKHENNVRLIDALGEFFPPEAVLFDMDGVLADVSGSYRSAIVQTAEYFLGRVVDPFQIDAYKNRGGFNNDWDLTAALIKEGGKNPAKDEVIKKFQEFYIGNGFDGLIRNEQCCITKECLEALKKRYRLGIVTGRPREEAEYFLRANGLSRYFNTVICMEDTGEKGKPDPYGIQLAMERFDVRRGVYLGDTVDDIAAACAVGLIPVGVNRNAEQAKILIEAGAAFVLASANEIEGRLV